MREQERLLVKVQHQLQWRPQSIGDPRATRQPLRTMASVEPTRQAVCAEDGKDRERGLPRPFGAQRIVSGPHTSGNKLSTLNFDFALI